MNFGLLKNSEEKSFEKDSSLLAVTIVTRFILFLVLYLPHYIFFRSNSSLYEWFIFYGIINALALVNYLIFEEKLKVQIFLNPLIFQVVTILIELVIITNIVYYSGGIFSNFLFLYIFSIISAAVAFNILGAVISSILVILSLGLIYYFQINNFPNVKDSGEMLLKVYYFNVMSFFALGIVVGILSKKITIAGKVISEKEKFAAIGEISSNLAHEIKNPLAAIRGSVQMLTSEHVYNKEKLTKLIMKEIDRLDDLLKDFFTISKQRDVELEEFNLVELVNEVLFLNMNDLDIKGTESYELVLVDRYPSGLVYSDRNLLRQVIINLVNNAIDESHKFSTKNRIEVEVNKQSSKVILIVRDDCGGIDKEIFGDIFLPFVSKKLKGSGIGLSVVKSIIDQLNIDLSYKNIKKNDKVIGTEFILSI